MQSSVKNQLGAVRRGRGVGAAELARRAGVSRQTIYAIEAGSFVPNTEVALRLAHELEVTVDALFTLEAEGPFERKPIKAEVLSPGAPVSGQGVQVCRVGDRLVSVPVNAAPYFLPEADGIIAKPARKAGTAALLMFAPEERSTKRLALAGCDPATGLLARTVERESGVEVITAAASSRLALNWLREGKVHVAGSHLKDPETGEFNLPILRRDYPGEDFAVVTFARWEEGFVTARGNPANIRTAADLARPSIRLVNREVGAGSRALLDNLLAQAGIPSVKVHGYERIAFGHLAAAYAVHNGEADCCIATRAAARAFNLDFIPIQSERYDFVIHRGSLDLPAVRSFLDVLMKAKLRRKLEVLAGYDTAQTGVVQA
ncbi:MAG: molybdate metabolism transcriptional regulator [Candidatus Solibacter sp.]|nr:molybdate metabolism transcriptional regulator [Candidatus Solibacter sp.]